MNQPTTPPIATFKPGDKITGTAMLGEHKGQPVTGEYLKPFGAAHCCALLILADDGTRIPVSADSAQLAAPAPALAGSLRQLADLVDKHPEIAAWYRYPSLDEHQSGPAEARNLDAFAAVFGLDIATNVGVLALRLQCDTADYLAAAEKAGGTE